MNTESIISLWKDRKYRSSLAQTDPSSAPEHPAGISFLTDKELALVAGSLCSCSPSAICCMTDSSLPSDCMSDCWNCNPDNRA